MKIHLHLGLYSDDVEYREHFEVKTNTDNWRKNLKSVLSKVTRIVDMAITEGVRQEAYDRMIQDEADKNE